MINRLETIFCRVMNQRNRRSDGEGGIVPCSSNYDANAKAWYRDGGGMEQEAEPRDPVALQVDGGPRCWLAR